MLKRLRYLLMSAVLYGLSSKSIGTVLVVYLERMDTPRIIEGLLFSASSLAFLLFPAIWGTISDVTKKPKLVMILSLLVSSSIIPLFILITNPWLIVGLRFIFVMFVIGFSAPAFSQASLIGGSAKRGNALGFLNSAKGFGRGIGRIAAGILLAYASKYLTFMICTLAGIISAGILLNFEEYLDFESQMHADTLVGEIVHRLMPDVKDKALLKKNGFIWLLSSFVLRDIGILGTLALMPVYLLADAQFSEIMMGLLMALNPMSQFIFHLIFGKLADTFGRKKLICFGFFGSGIVPLLFSFESQTIVIAFGMVFIAFVYSSLINGTTAFIGDITPEGRGAELMGTLLTCRGVGGLMGPAVVGFLSSEAVLGFKPTFYIMSILIFLAFSLSVLKVEETLQSR